MRFVVDAYRIVILAALAAALIGGSYLLFTVLLANDPNSPVNDLAIGLFISAGVLIVLLVGATAIFISIHDRLVEMSGDSQRIADALERLEMPPRR